MLRLLLPLALVLFLRPDFARIELPIGAKVTATEGFDVSFWAKTGRIDIELQDGSPQSYFIKVVSADLGKNMVMGEFESMETMYRAARTSFHDLSHGANMPRSQIHIFSWTSIAI